MQHCDPVTGACAIQTPDAAAAFADKAAAERPVVRYIGDPMCSWCWGISPQVKRVEQYCEANGFDFALTVGGLRPGGGDVWDDRLKTFLRQEWQHIQKATGQVFSFALLESAGFDYDTEPACRAVVVAQMLRRTTSRHAPAFDVYTAIQRKFYTQGEDPKAAAFYPSICQECGLDESTFLALFHSQEARDSTSQQFMFCRQLGVQAFPSLLLEFQDRLHLLTTGYATFDTLVGRIDTIVSGGRA